MRGQIEEDNTKKCPAAELLKSINTAATKAPALTYKGLVSTVHIAIGILAVSWADQIACIFTSQMGSPQIFSRHK